MATVNDNRLTRRCVVPMFNNETLECEFEIIVYGRHASELMTVPNEVIQSIAERHPNHHSSLFELYNL